jgi:zinc and cadmium transporter
LRRRQRGTGRGDKPGCGGSRADGEHPAVASAVIFGDSLHNFIDGIAIALSFSADTSLGVATTTAVLFHEIPQEIGDFAVLLHLGYSRAKVLLYNLLSALATFAGALLGYFSISFIGEYVPGFLGFAAGSFIYIAVSDLLPELKHKARAGDVGHLAAIVLGVLLIWFVGSVVPE